MLLSKIQVTKLFDLDGNFCRDLHMPEYKWYVMTSWQFCLILLQILEILSNEDTCGLNALHWIGTRNNEIPHHTPRIFPIAITLYKTTVSRFSTPNYYIVWSAKWNMVLLHRLSVSCNWFFLFGARQSKYIGSKLTGGFSKQFPYLALRSRKFVDIKTK